jgi:hypothetical protein
VLVGEAESDAVVLGVGVPVWLGVLLGVAELEREGAAVAVAAASCGASSSHAGAPL